MQKHIYSIVFASLLLTGFGQPLLAQRVGVLTPNPQAPFHVASSGQVNTPGGLVVLGDTSEAHLEMDFNLLQSKFGSGPLMLELQPQGGNLRVGANLIHVNSTNSNVGIGINSPESHLHVAGSTDQFVKVHRTTGGAGMSGLDLLRDIGLSGTDYRIVNDGGVLQFRDAIDNFATEGDLNMVMTPSGNIGIGTESPNSRLHVIGTELVGETGDGYFQLGAPAGFHLRFDNNEILARNGDNPSVLYLQFWSGDLSLCASTAGRVGLGTSSPQAKLHVTSGTDVTLGSGGQAVLGPTSGENIAIDGDEIQARNNGSASSMSIQLLGGNLLLCDPGTARVGIGTLSPQAKVHITDGTDVTLGGGGQLVLGPTTGLNLALDGNEIQARSNGAIAALNLQASGGDVLLCPNETGQVGIGVTSSIFMPSDDYLLAVDGKIISEEVRVELSGSWPDYVFHIDYALTPLTQLEEHISALGHLPGIPSAAQVESDGILLGDMQRAMMEKIEELTLYVIDLQKQIEELRKSE